MQPLALGLIDAGPGNGLLHSGRHFSRRRERVTSLRKSSPNSDGKMTAVLR